MRWVMVLVMLCVIGFGVVDLRRTRAEQTPLRVAVDLFALDRFESVQHVEFEASAQLDNILPYNYVETTEKNGVKSETKREQRLLIPLRRLQSTPGPLRHVALVDIPDSRHADAEDPNIPFSETQTKFRGLVAPLPPWMKKMKELEHFGFPPGCRLTRFHLGRKPLGEDHAWIFVGAGAVGLIACLLGAVFGAPRRTTDTELELAAAPTELTVSDEWVPYFEARLSWPLGFFLLVVGLGFILGTMYMRHIRYGDGADNLVLLGLGMGFGEMILFALVGMAHGRAELSSAGLYIQSGFTGRVQRARWSEIRWMSHMAVSNHGLLNHTVTFGLADETTMSMNLTGASGTETANRVAQTLAVYLMPDVKKRYDEGHSLDFGPLRLDRQSVHVKGTFGSWTEIELGDLASISLANGALTFKKKGAYLNAGSVGWGTLRNAFLLPGLITERLAIVNPEATVSW